MKVEKSYWANDNRDQYQIEVFRMPRGYQGRLSFTADFASKSTMESNSGDNAKRAKLLYSSIDFESIPDAVAFCKKYAEDLAEKELVWIDERQPT